ncbi:hypothetical protein AAH134_28390, partial [Bacteroides thetaiotaomicron]|uniref:hypothetical protein n=1 Tax=Bacteroides thetaiotaomicron TaxID=818 RepID=UPI0039B6DEB2
ICELFFRRVPAGTRLKGATLKLETYKYTHICSVFSSRYLQSNGKTDHQDEMDYEMTANKFFIY